MALNRDWDRVSKKCDKKEAKGIYRKEDMCKRAIKRYKGDVEKKEQRLKYKKKKTIE